MPLLPVEPPHLAQICRAADGIQAGRRLVQEQDLGVVHQGHREIQPSPHATRVGLDATIDRVPQVDQARSAPPPGSARRPWGSRTGWPAGRGARGRSGPGRARPPGARRRSGSARPPCPGTTSAPATIGASGRRPQEGREDAHQGGLAGAVGTQEPVDLAGFDRHVDAVEGDGLTEDPSDSDGTDRRLRWVRVGRAGRRGKAHDAHASCSGPERVRIARNTTAQAGGGRAKRGRALPLAPWDPRGEPSWRP